MKLPEDKKERNKILALIGIGAIVVVAVLFKMPVIGIMPLLASKQAKLAKMEVLRDDIEKANKEIKQHEKDKVENLEVLKKIIETSDIYVLKPVLGNYKLSASEIVEPAAKKMNIKLDQMRQIGVAPEANQTSYRAFSARVAVFCSYYEMVKLIREIEAGNPLLSVLNISITAQAEFPEKHLIAFDVQWPVWADVETSAKLAKQLQDLTKTPESGAK